MLEQLAEGGQDLVGGPAGQHQRAPRHPQADAESGFSRATPAYVADERVHPSVGRLDHVVEVPAEQVLLTAGQAPRRHAQPRVSQQRRGQQAALQPGVLLGLNLRHPEFPLGFLGPAPLDRVPDHAMQHVPGYLALDQVVLRSGPDRLLAQVLVRLPGQHHDGRLRVDPQQLPQPLQANGVGQAQVEQHAGRLGDHGTGLAEGARTLEDHRGVHLTQQLLHEQRVAVVVLNEQDGRPVRVTGGGCGVKLSVTYHRDLYLCLTWRAAGAQYSRHSIMPARRMFGIPRYRGAGGGARCRDR